MPVGFAGWSQLAVDASIMLAGFAVLGLWALVGSGKKDDDEDS